MERYHATSMLSLTARHPALAGRLDFKRFVFGRAACPLLRRCIRARRHCNSWNTLRENRRQLPLGFHRAPRSEPGGHSLSCNRNQALPRQLLRFCRNCWLHDVFHNVFADLTPHIRPNAG